MFADACLITDVPSFEDEVQTSPKLLKWTASPNPQELLVIQPNELEKVFTAQVESAHDLDQPIGVRLYLNYGVPATEQSLRPFLVNIPGAAVAPSEEVTSGEERVARVRWLQREPITLGGCNTFTMMVSHRFDDETGCPEELSDSDEITWVAYICPPGETCDTSNFDPTTDCPKPTRKCPKVADEAALATSATGGP